MIPATFEEAVARLRAATQPADVFDVDSAASAYRAWAKLVHPDRVSGDRAGSANWAFTRLTELWRAVRTAARPMTVTGAVGRYLVLRPVGSDELATYIEAGRESDPGDDVLLKVVRRPGDNDLFRTEEAMLRELHRSADRRHLAYLPRLFDAFRYREEASGADRAVNVLDRLSGFVSLAGVRAAYPDGVDPRDAAWMWRRLLVALGTAHRAGVVHGAVVPDHVLIEPAEHGLVVVNWCFGGRLSTGDRVAAVMDRYRDWYAPEILRREEPTPGSDIFLATRCMLALMRRRVPDALRRFAQGCLGAPSGRPHDAWVLLAELDQVLARLYGVRRFRPFAMPASAPAWPQQPRTRPTKTQGR